MTPTITTAILPIDSSVSPKSLAVATPSVCPLVPNAKPRAIGLEILNHLTILVPKAEITTALRITANDVSSLTPPIPVDTGNAIAVVAACGSIEALTVFPNWNNVETK